MFWSIDYHEFSINHYTIFCFDCNKFQQNSNIITSCPVNVHHKICRIPHINNLNNFTKEKRDKSLHISEPFMFQLFDKFHARFEEVNEILEFEKTDEFNNILTLSNSIQMAAIQKIQNIKFSNQTLNKYLEKVIIIFNRTYYKSDYEYLKLYTNHLLRHYIFQLFEMKNHYFSQTIEPPSLYDVLNEHNYFGESSIDEILHGKINDFIQKLVMHNEKIKLIQTFKPTELTMYCMIITEIIPNQKYRTYLSPVVNVIHEKYKSDINVIDEYYRNHNYEYYIAIHEFDENNYCQREKEHREKINEDLKCVKFERIDEDENLTYPLISNSGNLDCKIIICTNAKSDNLKNKFVLKRFYSDNTTSQITSSYTKHDFSNLTYFNYILENQLYVMFLVDDNTYLTVNTFENCIIKSDRHCERIIMESHIETYGFETGNPIRDVRNITSIQAISKLKKNPEKTNMILNARYLCFDMEFTVNEDNVIIHNQNDTNITIPKNKDVTILLHTLNKFENMYPYDLDENNRLKKLIQWRSI